MLTTSIGICAYNEEKNIGKLLDRLSKEKFNLDLKEIIVVASGCTDRTVEIVNQFLTKNKKIKLIVEDKRKGKSSAINLILKHAKGNIIVFCDADDLPQQKGINKLIQPFLEKNVGGVTSRVVPIVHRSLFGSLIKLFWYFHHRIAIQMPKMNGQLCAIRKDVVTAIPHDIISDDAYMEAMIRRKELRTVYIPTAIIYTSVPKNLINFLKQRRRVIRGYIQLAALNLDVSIPSKMLFKLVVEETIRRPSLTLEILFLTMSEILASILAHYDAFNKKTPYCWEKIG